MAQGYDVDNTIHHTGDKVVVEHSQDCQATIDSIAVAKAQGLGDRGGMKLAARIPQVLFMQWAYEDCGDKLAYLQGKHNRDPELARKLAIRLNSQEFQQLRVWEGNIAASDMTKTGNKMHDKDK